MIIVSGHLNVPAEVRTAFLVDALAVIVSARAAPGCIDFHLSADPIDPSRVNVFEQWNSVDAVEAFRGSGPSGEQQALILGAEVHQHTISSSVRL